VAAAAGEEEWRIKALLLVQGLYDSLAPGWRPDLERVIGLLLGYDRQDVEIHSVAPNPVSFKLTHHLGVTSLAARTGDLLASLSP